MRAGDRIASPDIINSEPATEFQVIGLESLVRMKLIAYRHTYRMHLRDLMDVGQIDATWPARFPPPLDEPNG